MEEIHRIVIDIGSHMIRIGESNDETFEQIPKYQVFSAYPIDNVEHSIHETINEESEINFCIKNGSVNNIDRLYFILEETLPALLSDDQPFELHCSHVPQTNLHYIPKLVEFSYETCGASSVLFKSNALQILAANNFETGICIDIGHSSAHTAVSVDNIVSQHIFKKSLIGGHAINSALMYLLKGESSYRNFGEYMHVNQEKSRFKVSQDPVTVEFLDSLSIDEARGMISTEVLFNNDIWLYVAKHPEEKMDIPKYREDSGLSSLIVNTINDSPLGSRKAIAEHIILSGGCSHIPGLLSRVYQEVSRKLATNVNISLEENSELAGWIASSINAPKHSIESGLVSSSYFEENGIDLTISKFGIK